MVSDERISRVLRLLRGAIRAAGYTQTELDDRIGRRRGYLSHVFQRRVDLKVHDLLLVLEALQIDPESFFTTALKSQDGPQLDDLIELVTASESRQAGWTGADAAPAPSAGKTPEARPTPADDQELLDRVRVIVRQVLTSLPRGDRQGTG